MYTNDHFNNYLVESKLRELIAERGGAAGNEVHPIRVAFGQILIKVGVALTSRPNRPIDAPLPGSAVAQ